MGSFNLDPRSISLNCEQGILVSHPALHSALWKIFEHLRHGKRAFRVQLDEHDKLLWTDHQQTLQREPNARFMKRAFAMLMRFLPFDSQL